MLNTDKEKSIDGASSHDIHGEHASHQILKYVRVVLALLCLVSITLMFVDFTGAARSVLPWLAKVQLIPALLSVNVLAIAFVLALTLLCGRVYCSVICPLGVFQDVVNWLKGRATNRRRRYLRFRFTAAKTRLRLTVLTVFAVLLILGLTQLLAASIAGLIEPYSAYGRIASQIFAPAYASVNNMLAAWSESQPDNYTFYRVTAAVSIPVLAVAIITLVTIVIFAWRGGRDYCNTICPVGTLLGYLSRYSLFKPVIDTTHCINCGRCARNCKAKCIDARHHAIDYTRCVACMDCLTTCTEGAISYTWRRHNADKPQGDTPSDNGRRTFVSTVALVSGAMAGNAIAKTTDGGLTALTDKQPARRQTAVVPAGAVSLRHLSQHCTACQLCVQSCPNHVLKPSTDLRHFMQPRLDFTDGYCDPSCTVCANICPAGAFHPIDEAQKSSVKIGTAVVDLEACIVAADGKRCGNCARHCKAGAITMAPVSEDDPQGHWMPVVNAARCIGCGECEYYCPSGTVEGMHHATSAIHVEGVEMHRTI